MYFSSKKISLMIKKNNKYPDPMDTIHKLRIIKKQYSPNINQPVLEESWSDLKDSIRLVGHLLSRIIPRTQQLLTQKNKSQEKSFSMHHGQNSKIKLD